MLTDAWEIFEDLFDTGEEVVIITDANIFDWGRISWKRESDEFSLLTLGYRRPRRTYKFSELLFIAHDGFPVKSVFGSEAKDGDGKSDLVRAYFKHKFRPASFRFGDPFEVCDVQAKLINNGNSGDEFDDHQFEEALILENADASAMLFNLPRISDFAISNP